MASRIKGITVEIGGDTSGLERALSDVNNSIKKTQSQLRDVNNLLKLDPSNTVLLAQKQELLQSAIGDTEQKQQTLEQAQEEVTKAFERGDLGKGQYMAFQREVEETRGTLNRYKADLPGLQSEQERLSTNTERLSKLFADSPAGARASGIVYTLVETAKLNHLDVFGYLCYLLENLPDLDHRNHPELLEAYLPWSETLPESCRLREHRTNKKCMF